jgi:hypothetical protein
LPSGWPGGPALATRITVTTFALTNEQGGHGLHGTLPLELRRNHTVVLVHTPRVPPAARRDVAHVVERALQEEMHKSQSREAGEPFPVPSSDGRSG